MVRFCIIIYTYICICFFCVFLEVGNGRRRFPGRSLDGRDDWRSGAEIRHRRFFQVTTSGVCEDIFRFQGLSARAHLRQYVFLEES